MLGLAVAGAPGLSLAQHSGGHSGGGGGGGGAHFGGGGGGHFSGGSHFGGGGHFSGGSHFGGYSAVPHFSGTHFSGARTYSPGYGTAYAHAAHGAVIAGHATHFASPGAGWVGAHHGPAYYHGAFGHSYVPGNGYWHGAHYWGGGYWNGVYWPHCYFRPGFAWFLPVLPFGYATFWWGGLPYYYWDNLYYTWNPAYNGYVVSDPPPVEGDASYDTTTDANAVSAEPYAGGGDGAGAAGAAADVFVYPRNGQNEQQTNTDRYECHSWAVNQTGYDPTRPGQGGRSNPAEYRRAMIACLDARGYSAR